MESVSRDGSVAAFVVAVFLVPHALDGVSRSAVDAPHQRNPDDGVWFLVGLCGPVPEPCGVPGFTVREGPESADVAAAGTPQRLVLVPSRHLLQCFPVVFGFAGDDRVSGVVALCVVMPVGFFRLPPT